MSLQCLKEITKKPKNVFCLSFVMLISEHFKTRFEDINFLTVPYTLIAF